MSLFGTALRPKRLPASSSVAAAASAYATTIYRPASRLEQGESNKTLSGHGGDSRWRVAEKRRRSDEKNLDEIFIRSLVTASSCQASPRLMRDHGLLRGRVTDSRRTRTRKRLFSSRTAHGRTTAEGAPEEQDNGAAKRSKYKDLVNTYDSPSDLWEKSSHKGAWHDTPAQASSGHQPLAPRLVITPEEEQRHSQSPRVILRAQNAEDAKRIRYLKALCFNQRRGFFTELIYKQYLALPRPQPRYLNDATFHKLLQHLSWVEFRDEEASRRFFSVLEDGLEAGVHMRADMWNSAIAFTNGWTQRRASGGEQVKHAVETWMRMENARAKPSHVTFNILFSAAVHARRFALADTIARELKARKLPLNRFFRVSMIIYAGYRGGGDSVRRAFREMIDAGEIVDTSVMNCVIMSLIRAGEAASASHVFTKMKHLHESKVESGDFETPSRALTWQERRTVSRKLNISAVELRRQQEEHESSFFGSHFSSDKHREAVQRLAPIHPDPQTCRLLILHHCTTTGDLESVRELIEETRSEACNAGKQTLHGSVYMFLFRGFWRWGGHPYTAWNLRSLEAYWEEFLEATSPEVHAQAVQEAKERAEEIGGAITSASLDDSTYDEFTSDEVDAFAAQEGLTEEDKIISHEDTPPYFTAALVSRALYAFYKCAGRKKVMEVWAQTQRHWNDMSQDDREKVEAHVDRIGRDDDGKW